MLLQQEKTSLANMREIEFRKKMEQESKGSKDSKRPVPFKKYWSTDTFENTKIAKILEETFKDIIIDENSLFLTIDGVKSISAAIILIHIFN
ncbi:hypothetical protein HK099_003199 [Clydaea vesicula]|uniref:Uncharacterized protein n=1 Tax=Clydaea vesicula TaxID=447962 RepID=A0AAD5U588_9FUNG|nr:hypothetical protein HK099_003199 [Clydaea vesicula]